MTEPAKKTAATKTAVTTDHDRVAMLSVKADGTLDQTDPELIGDKDAARAATEKQFAQQAVSVVDTERVLSDEPPASPEDVKAEHEKVAAAAEKRAGDVVDSLHQG